MFGEYAKEQGETEASFPKISYIPSEHVLKKAGSIGVAIPGGTLHIVKMTSELILLRNMKIFLKVMGVMAYFIQKTLQQYIWMDITQ